MGTRLRSVVCSTQVIVIRLPDGAGDLKLECGGAPMVELDDTTDIRGDADAAFMTGTQVGKRFVNDELGIEVLCTVAGEGSLAIGGEPLSLKQAKPLPASD